MSDFDFDHFILGVSDLGEGSKLFKKKTGVTPVFGGLHPSLGTHNALVSLDTSYFELLAANPSSEVKEIKVKSLTTYKLPKMIGWALQCRDFEKLAKTLEAFGLKLSPVEKGQRESPQKQILKYEVAEILGLAEWGEAVPFFIKWIDTVHPSQTSPRGCKLSHLSITCPKAKSLKRFVETSGLPVEVNSGEEISIKIEISTLKGKVVFD